MVALDIPLIVDRILLLASHKVYAFTASLYLLKVLPRIDLLDTHRHVLHRLVDLRLVSDTGHLDVLQLLDTPLLSKLRIISTILVGAARSGHIHLLDWLLSVALPHITPAMFQMIADLSATGGHTRVLGWVVAHGTDMRFNFERAYVHATEAGQLHVLDWLKTHTTGHGIADSFPALNRLNTSQPITAAAQIKTLDWWKAEYAERGMPMVPADADFLPKYAWCVAEDKGLLIVDWWRAYCAEVGRAFKWAALNNLMLFHLVVHNAPSLCRWWWDETVQQIGILRSKEILQDILDSICERGRPQFLDWYFDMCVKSAGVIETPRHWRPRVPFTQLDVIQWWETKVETNQVDPDVFSMVNSEYHTELDTILRVPASATIDTSALDWWWARRDRFGLEARITQWTMTRMMMDRDPEVIQWFLDRCTPDSPPPHLNLDMVTKAISLGQFDMFEKLLAKTSFDTTEMETEIKIPLYFRRIASSAVLDYLWNFCALVGVRFEPGYNTKSAITAIKEGDNDAARWWYAMHRVHGTAFPSAEELGRIKYVFDKEMLSWIKSVQGLLLRNQP
ncbi:hypothetical protein BC828DRAFT_390919 [Blastocladiella britannica]|nr:hypothetical protein BC828DRAFT_390919 [Blastocladiella britannica]